MDQQYQAIQFNNGLFVIDTTQPSKFEFKAVCKAQHQDWKTQLVRDDFMGMEKDEESSLLYIFQNFEGIFCRVKTRTGKVCDILPIDLDVINFN